MHLAWRARQLRWSCKVAIWHICIQPNHKSRGKVTQTQHNIHLKHFQHLPTLPKTPSLLPSKYVSCSYKRWQACRLSSSISSQRHVMRHPWQKQRHELYVKCVHFFHGFQNSWCDFPFCQRYFSFFPFFSHAAKRTRLVCMRTRCTRSTWWQTQTTTWSCHTQVLMEEMAHQSTQRISRFARVFSYIPIGARFLSSTVSKRHLFDRNNMKPNSSQRASALSALARWPQLCEKTRQVHTADHFESSCNIFSCISSVTRRPVLLQ